MSQKKAYLFIKNFKWPDVLNLVAYGVKNPANLTDQQRITRLYRANMRRYLMMHVEESVQGDYRSAYDKLADLREEFDQLKNLKSRKDLDLFYQNQEEFLEDTYDALQFVCESRPYAASIGRYVSFPNNWIQHDPHGFYSSKNTEAIPQLTEPFFEEYPQAMDHMLSTHVREVIVGQLL